MKILGSGFDHVEFVVRDLAARGSVYQRMGFECVGRRERPSRGTKSELWQQGYARILLTAPDDSITSKRAQTWVGDPHSVGETDLALGFLGAQGEGVTALAITVDNAAEWFDHTTAKGAVPALKPTRITTPDGEIVRAEIFTPGRLRYVFMERKSPRGELSASLFDEGLVASRLESPSPLLIRVIDHLTNNVAMGELERWMRWYRDVMDFVVTGHFDLRTAKTGLISEVVESRCGKIKVPINEGTEKSSQVQEFVDRLKGPGVQHLAFLTTDILETLPKLRRMEFEFLTVPHTYYEAVPARVPGVTESLAKLEEQGILLDGTEQGYLLQIFTTEVLGPFFFEIIQRKGNRGFGEGNFKALFEAIERDQIRRGVLS